MVAKRRKTAEEHGQHGCRLLYKLTIPSQRATIPSKWAIVIQ